ncbi:MAG: hypothetical protein K2Z80_00685 [Xanthobacteraceae bacterium]|nr:hypothetical protein [Xanthobacteraceae bacterium]
MIAKEELLSDSTPINERNCRVELAKLPIAPLAETDKEGRLRFAGFWPGELALNQRLCVAVAGVSANAVEKRLETEVERAKKEFEDQDQAYQSALADERQANTDLAAAKSALQQKPDEADLKSKAANAQKNLDAKRAELTRLSGERTKAQDKLNQALAALNAGLPPVELALYLENRRGPNLTIKAQPISGLQYLFFDLKPSVQADTDDGKFWRALFSQGLKGGEKELAVGIARMTNGAADTPQANAPRRATLVVYRPWPSLFGALAVVLLTISLCAYAATSPLLRDNSLTYEQVNNENNNTASPPTAERKAELAPALMTIGDLQKDLSGAALTRAMATAAGPFSLGRVQMAMWFVLAFSGFCFIWLTTGQFFNVVTPQILVLLGIQAATGIAAVQLGAPSDATRVSHGFLRDIVSDASRPTVHRLQVVAWTVIMGVIFLWSVISSFSFPAFDTNLLLLMGIFNSTYLGFKQAEK